jgi:hypothetical protein
VIGFILFRTKTLVCKDALHRESIMQKYFRDSTLVTSYKNRFPISRPGDCAIPSRRSSVHCSIRLDDMPYRPDARQTKHLLPRRRGLLSEPSTISRSFCASLHPSGRLSSPSGRCPVIDQLQIFFPSSNKGRLMQPSRRHGFPSGRAHT